MRIAFVAPSFPELSETFILRQAVSLGQRGHDVHVYVRAPPSTRSVLPDDIQAYFDTRIHYLTSQTGPTGEPSTRSGRIRAYMGSLRFLYDHTKGRPSLGEIRQWARLLPRLAGEPRFDIVHCHYGDFGLYYRHLGAYWSAPLITSFYGYDCSKYPGTRRPGVFDPLFSTADAITVLGQRMAQRVIALGCPSELVHTVPLSVDPVVFPYNPRGISHPAAARLLTVARLVEKKGLDVALRAVAEAVRHYPSLQYDIIGDGPLHAELEALAASLSLTNHVRFHGARQAEAVREAFDAADLFILPSRTASDGDEEGTPTVLLEAMSSGLPVLSTRHSDIPDIVEDGESGFLVPEGDVGALSERLLYLLNHRESWPGIGHAGRRRVEERHTTERVGAMLERLYRDLRAHPRHVPSPDGGPASPLGGSE